jgi:Ca2+-binding EF-hand superfamily protein
MTTEKRNTHAHTLCGMDKETLINAFFNFDQDKDGFISCEDLMIAMMTKGAKMSAEEVQQ